MPSPFPGMNPFFEYPADWPDFHQEFLGRAKSSLAKRLPERYKVTTELRITFRQPTKADLPIEYIEADLGLLGKNGLRIPAGVATTEAPVQLIVGEIEERHRWLRIAEIDTRRVVAIIEMLSPTNKRKGKGRKKYIAKRDRVFRSTAHFIEIDLLRGGTRPEWPLLPACDYYALVSKAAVDRTAGLWPISLRDRLPIIPIPLLDPDLPIALDLQALLHECYDESAYERHLFKNQPDPPLSPDDAAWAASLIPPGVRRS